MGQLFDSRTGYVVCGGCGRTGGGTRKRPCTFKVVSSASHGGGRVSMPYCPPPTLCSACFAAEGGGKGVHARCAEGAAASQAAYDAEQAKLEAGDMLVTSASYAELEGWTWVSFAGLHGERITVCMPSRDYCTHDFSFNEYVDLTTVRHELPAA